MQSSQESNLDSYLEEQMKGTEELAKSANSANETVKRYLRDRAERLLAGEQMKRSRWDRAGAERLAREVLETANMEASSLYNLFNLHLRNELEPLMGTEFVEDAKDQGVAEGTVAASSKVESLAPLQGRGGHGASAERSFHCIEGCVFEGEGNYLAHRDRGHHPIPV